VKIYDEVGAGRRIEHDRFIVDLDKYFEKLKKKIDG
jgi:hypothetical protein